MLVLRKVELRTGVVMVEDVFDAEELEWESDEENIVGRIAALKDVEAAAEENPPREQELPKERPAELPYVAKCAVPFLDHGMPIDVNAFETLISALVAFAFGAEDRNLVAVLIKRTGLLPHARVKWHGKVFDDD